MEVNKKEESIYSTNNTIQCRVQHSVRRLEEMVASTLEENTKGRSCFKTIFIVFIMSQLLLNGQCSDGNGLL